MSERRLTFGFGRNHEVEVDILATRAGIAVEVSSDDMTTWDVTWDELVPDSMKVVPADAIVVIPRELPAVKHAGWGAEGEDLWQVGDQELRTQPGRSAFELDRAAWAWLALALHRRAHPPVSQDVVDRLRADLVAAKPVPGSHSITEGIARRLVEQGWTKQEPTP